MALHESLPIYKKALDMAVYFEKIVRNFSRYHKYTVGSELRNLSKEIVILIKIVKEIKAFRSFRSFEYSIKGGLTCLRRQ